jgi:gas vesicle protein
MSERDGFDSFLIGFIIGGIAGAIVALLLAPQSGTETLSLVKERSIELRQTARKRLDGLAKQVREYGKEMYPEFDESVSEVAEPYGTGGGRPEKQV